MKMAFIHVVFRTSSLYEHTFILHIFLTSSSLRTYEPRQSLVPSPAHKKCASPDGAGHSAPRLQPKASKQATHVYFCTETARPQISMGTAYEGLYALDGS